MLDSTGAWVGWRLRPAFAMERARNQVPIAGLRDAHPRMDHSHDLVAISMFRAAGAWAILGGPRSLRRSICDPLFATRDE
jgi:hypothetical protein